MCILFAPCLLEGRSSSSSSRELEGSKPQAGGQGGEGVEGGGARGRLSYSQWGLGEA